MRNFFAYEKHVGYTPGSSNFNACFTQITSSKIKHSFWFDWLIFFLFGELILFDWVQLKFGSGGFDLPCRAFFTLFHSMKRRKIPLSKTSVPIFRNSHITLANPTRHRDWTFTIELRLFYTNHKFRNWMFAWVQLIFFFFLVSLILFDCWIQLNSTMNWFWLSSI